MKAENFVREYTTLVPTFDKFLESGYSKEPANELIKRSYIRKREKPLLNSVYRR